MAKRSWHQEKQFGITVGSVLLAMAGWLFWRGHGPVATAAPAFVGALLVVFGVGYPRALVHPNRAWMALAEALSWVSTRVILGLLFFLVFAPLGAWRRMRGWDPLNRRASRSRRSFWQPVLRPPGRLEALREDVLTPGAGSREPKGSVSVGKLQVLVEFWEFLRYNKKYWIAPIVIFLVLAGLILVLAQATPIAPFIYTLF